MERSRESRRSDQNRSALNRSAVNRSANAPNNRSVDISRASDRDDPVGAIARDSVNNGSRQLRIEEERDSDDDD